MAKLDLNRVPMPRQDPKERKRNFREVALGYKSEEAKREAGRCIQCPEHPCTKGCPVGVDIPGFIKALLEGDIPEAARVLKDKNSLPGICGRVCPQETQCESVCTLAKKDAPIAIGRLERYVADWERSGKRGEASKGPASPEGLLPSASTASSSSLSTAPSSSPSTAPSSSRPTSPPSTSSLSLAAARRIAVIGSGPAGLTAAADLVKLGYAVTIFEALHVAGGVLMYGIPEFRLPKDIVQSEIDYIRSLGVELKLDSVIGKIDTVDELLDSGYNAVFIATGAGLPMFLDLPGENLCGIYSANEFLTRTVLMKGYLYPEYDTPVEMGKQVAIIGGGNVAMDAARCALRLGAEKVYVVYRRSEAEMPARREEIENARDEGIIFKFLTNPLGFLANGHGWVNAIECITMDLGEPDSSGRCRPVARKGSEFLLPVDTVIVALGNNPNPLIPQTTKGLETGRKGTVVADDATGKTKKPGVWAGGDIVTGAATVISAMGAGRRAAASIDRYLRGEDEDGGENENRGENEDRGEDKG